MGPVSDETVILADHTDRLIGSQPLPRGLLLEPFNLTMKLDTRGV